MEKPREVDCSSKAQTLLNYCRAARMEGGCTLQEQLNALLSAASLPLPSLSPWPAWGCLPGGRGEG